MNEIIRHCPRKQFMLAILVLAGSMIDLSYNYVIRRNGLEIAEDLLMNFGPLREVKLYQFNICSIIILLLCLNITSTRIKNYRKIYIIQVQKNSQISYTNNQEFKSYNWILWNYFYRSEKFSVISR